MTTQLVPASPGQRVLIVDDCEADRQLLARFLRQAGYWIYLGDNGRDGFEKARYLQPDLVLMDIRMPVCDGLAACRLLKLDPTTASIPLIFLTAAHLPEERIQGLSEGAVDYITKPFNFEEVRLRVRIHLHAGHGNASRILPIQLDAEALTGNDVEQDSLREPLDALIFRAAQRLLFEQMAEPPDLASLARAVGTNSRRLTEIFRQHAGATVFDYLREVRMERARCLLEQTMLEIGTIAGDLGFGSAASFSTSFRERFGLSPRQYRSARLTPAETDSSAP